MHSLVSRRRMWSVGIGAVLAMACRGGPQAGPPRQDPGPTPGTRSQTVSGHLGGVYNVRDFQAKGDGSSDDTLAIQAAINAAADGNLGGDVYFPIGTYIVTGLILHPRVNLVGAGVGTSLGWGTLVKLKAGSDTSVITSSEGGPGGVHHWSRIANLRIDGNKENNTAGHGILVPGYSGEGFLVDHVFVSNCSEHGIFIASGTVPLYLRDVHPFGCDGSGIKIARANGQRVITALLEVISGDDNAVALIEIDGVNSGPVVMVGIKSERHPNAILIKNGDGGTFVINGIGGTANASETKNALIRVEGASTSAQVIWSGANKDANISYVYDNSATGAQVATSANGTRHTSGIDGSTSYTRRLAPLVASPPQLTADVNNYTQARSRYGGCHLTSRERSLASSRQRVWRASCSRS